MARYVLEGEWTGYSSAQCHIVHREVVDQARYGRLKGLHAIVYTDGTSLILRLSETKPRAKVEVKNGYGSLIRDAEAYHIKTGESRVLVKDLS